MSYIEENLRKGEKVIYRANKHLFVFSIPIFWCVIGLSFLTSISDLQKLSIIPLFISLITLINSCIEYFLSEIALTNTYLLIKLGVLKKHFIETNLKDIKSVQVKQTLLGRMFKYGSIEFCNMKNSCLKLDRVADPVKFRDRVQKEIDRLNE